MERWQPITQQRLQSMIDEQLIDCTDKQRQIFNTYQIPLKQIDLLRFGQWEPVFVIAQKNNEILYYDDVEDGFNYSVLDKDGRIKPRTCNQDELHFALQYWMQK